MSFVPREDLVGMLMNLGISRNAATRALLYTGNTDANMAAGYVFENPDNMNLELPLTESELDQSSDDDAGALAEVADFLLPGEFYKMVFVVNCDLDMGVGKVAAQVAHSALALYKQMFNDRAKHGAALHAWEQFGETKVVLKGLNAVHLTELATKAESKQLANYIVEDAGRTEVSAGSMTVLGIMGRVDKVDEVTGNLSLLA